MTRDLVTLGEAGIRLAPPAGTPLASATTLSMDVIGAELNVAAALQSLGWATSWLSGVHQSQIGDLIMQRVRRCDVDTQHVQRILTGRTSVYYVEYLDPAEPNRTLQDRVDSSFHSVSVEAIDWDAFLDARVLHVTGISLALGPGPRTLVEQAVTEARSRGLTVSLDVNHRPNLWSSDEARQVIEPLLGMADVVFCSARDASALFGLAGDRAPSGLMEHGPHTAVVSQAEEGVVVETRDGSSTAPSVVDRWVDRLGAGDAMAAGVLHALLGDQMEFAADYGARMAALAIGQWGEQVLTTADELRSWHRSHRSLHRDHIPRLQPATQQGGKK